MSAGYRSDRVRSWLDPDNDPQDTGYQARQAKFALAHGGIFGDGLGQGVAKWNYLPNAHNDFIFAIIGEELGFVGALGLLGALRVVRLHRHADRAPIGRPVPAAADRHHDDVGAGPGVHQHRLRDRHAAGHRSAAATDLCRRNINGHNAFHDRHHGQRGSTRTGGGGRAASRARRQGEPGAAAAAARAVCADPSRGVSRPQADSAEARQAATCRQAARGPHAAPANPEPPLRSACPEQPPGRRVGKGIMDLASGTPASVILRRVRALEGQRYG